jgi:hypothetical protein
VLRHNSMRVFLKPFDGLDRSSLVNIGDHEPPNQPQMPGAGSSGNALAGTWDRQRGRQRGRCIIGIVTPCCTSRLEGEAALGVETRGAGEAEELGSMGS